MQKLQNVPEGSKVKMSAKKCHTMSKEIQEVIVDFRDITSKTNNIDLDLIGFLKSLVDFRRGRITKLNLKQKTNHENIVCLVFFLFHSLNSLINIFFGPPCF